MENQQQKQQYTCPMHPEIIKDEPGDCPLCGMHLVPLKAAGISVETDSIPATINPGKMKMGKQQYTCSMHPKVIKDEPGKCPYCGMVLIPLKMNDGAKAGHNKHVNMIDDFKRRFYVVLILTIPIMLLSKMIQLWLKVKN